MTKFLAVMPYVYQPYADECFASMSHLFDSNVLLIDNTEHNKGVPESWNLGIDKAREIGADWLVIISAAVRFGQFGGTDIINQLELHDADVVHFSGKNMPEQSYIRGKEYADDLLGWHLTAIRMSVIEKVGYFDTNFFPAYFEDIDYDLRIRKALPEVTWLILPVDAHNESIGHGVKMGNVTIPINDLIAYFSTKWGRHPNATEISEYGRPFNDKNNSLAYFPPANGRLWND